MKFGSIEFIIQLKCDCGEKPLPFPTREFIHYISAEALRFDFIYGLEIETNRNVSTKYYCLKEDGTLAHSISFGQIIKKVAESDLRPCKNEVQSIFITEFC